MKTELRNLISKHWAGMLADEQIMAWKDPDIQGYNYQMDVDHVEERVRYYLSNVEENEELKDVYRLIIDDVDWEALKEEVLKEATSQWHIEKGTAQ